MEETKFFKNVWRFNGLIISVAGVLAIMVLFLAGYHTIKDVFRKRQVRNIANIAENISVKEVWTLGYMRQLDGTEYVMVPLQSDQSYAKSYYSKSSYSVRNFLFINVKTNGKEWLFPNNKWLIANNYTLSEKDHREKARKTKATLYNIAYSANVSLKDFTLSNQSELPKI